MKYKRLKLGALLMLGFGYMGLQAQTTATFTDSRDSNIYKTIKIGTQVWMAENLKYLPSVVGPAVGSDKTPYYYVHGYDGTNVADAKATTNYSIYGVLYNWEAAIASCPAGWHLPYDKEWDKLQAYLGQYPVGGKLKEAGITHWDSPNSVSTNESSFTALPGGSRGNGIFYDANGKTGAWWCAPIYNADLVPCRVMTSSASTVFQYNYTKELGYSVRCVKD